MIPVNSVAIVGAGTMGGGIAMVCANAGIPVLLKDTDQAALDRGLANIQKNYATSVKRGRFTQEYVDERMKMIKPTLSYDDFAGADMVIEAVFEGMALKKEVFAELDRVCKRGAILASNTSTLNIDEIAATTSRPEVGDRHALFQPGERDAAARNGARQQEQQGSDRHVHAAGEEDRQGRRCWWGTAADSSATGCSCRTFARRSSWWRKAPRPKRWTRRSRNGAWRWGRWPSGIWAGSTSAWRIRKEYRHLEKPGARQPYVEDRTLSKWGASGKRPDRAGTNTTQTGGRSSDPEVAELVKKWNAESGIPQRQISAEEIVEREVYWLVNEGARILEEGYALRAGDIDTIYLNGYGFPGFRGGPMWYADTVGLKKVYDRVCEFHKLHGMLWEPAPLLKKLAETGGKFAEFERGAAQATD